MERTTKQTCNCSTQDPSEVQTIEGISEGHDCNLPADVERILVEAKSVGSVATDITRDVTLTYATTRGASFQAGKTKARSAARKHLERLLQDTHTRLMSLTLNYSKKKKRKFREFSGEFKKILKDAYYKAYEYGLRSTGSAAFLTAGGSPLILPKDKKWIDSAFTQETRYLNKFLTDINTGKQPNKWPNRVGMYVATIGSIYYSGRVAVTPPNHALFWIAKLDNKICPQCKYMAVNSPFTKFNLPITPASGYTSCFSNCRCAIAVREVSKQYFDGLMGKPSRLSHMRRLKAAR